MGQSRGCLVKSVPGKSVPGTEDMAPKIWYRRYFWQRRSRVATRVPGTEDEAPKMGLQAPKMGLQARTGAERLPGKNKNRLGSGRRDAIKLGDYT